MNIKRIVNYETDQNCYLIYDDNKTGVIIDPGNSADYILEKVDGEGVKVKYILLTHCHYDHIEGAEELRKVLGAEVVSSFECSQNIQKQNINLSSLFSNPITMNPSDVIITDSSKINAGDLKIKVILTPGHTNGGVCYLIENELFSGDTLFLNSVGRVDFPTGNGEVLIKSIKEKLFVLDDDIVVHPGHGNDTKIHYEKKYNGYCR